HQRAEVSKMREQVRAIKPDEEQESLDRLLKRVGPRRTEIWTLKRFNLKSAHSRIEILALLAQEPRDQFGPISVAELASGRVAREVFRSADCNQLSGIERELARTAANRVLLASGH